MQRLLFSTAKFGELIRFVQQGALIRNSPSNCLISQLIVTRLTEFHRNRTIHFFLSRQGEICCRCFLTPSMSKVKKTWST